MTEFAHAAEPENEPPVTGELEFTMKGPPVSQQSTRVERDRFSHLVGKQIDSCTYLLSGDVKVEIEWFIHEQSRYESHTAPDVDNILKPLLDVVCGPHGVLIDDCQVQAVECHWIDWPDFDQQVRIRFRFFPDEWVPKHGLCFVHLGKGMCYPITRTAPAEVVLLIVEQLNRMIAMRDALIRAGRDYYQAKYVMSIQRVFHRSRINKFRVIELNALRNELKSEIA